MILFVPRGSGNAGSRVSQEFRLRSGEPRDRVIAMKALGRHTVADFAIGELGRNLLLGNGRRLGVLRAARPRKGDREDGGLQHQLWADDLHDAGSALPSLIG